MTATTNTTNTTVDTSIDATDTHAVLDAWSGAIKTTLRAERAALNAILVRPRPRISTILTTYAHFVYRKQTISSHSPAQTCNVRCMMLKTRYCVRRIRIS